MHSSAIIKYSQTTEGREIYTPVAFLVVSVVGLFDLLPGEFKGSISTWSLLFKKKIDIIYLILILN